LNEILKNSTKNKPFDFNGTLYVKFIHEAIANNLVQKLGGATSLELSNTWCSSTIIKAALALPQRLHYIVPFLRMYSERYVPFIQGDATKYYLSSKSDNPIKDVQRAMSNEFGKHQQDCVDFKKEPMKMIDEVDNLLQTVWNKPEDLELILQPDNDIEKNKNLHLLVYNQILYFYPIADNVCARIIQIRQDKKPNIAFFIEKYYC
jgi:hypothetical protein